MHYDRREVLEHADSEVIAKALGLEIKRNGRFKWILCPGHMEYFGKPDTAYGNCNLTDKGYHCFACDRTVNVFDMVMEVKGCSFKEALEFVAEMSDMPITTEKTKNKRYNKKKKYKKPIFSREELELIGITSFNRDTPIKQEISKEEGEKIINNHELHRFHLTDEKYNTLELTGEKTTTLYELEMNDFDTFYAMVFGKITEAINKRNDAIKFVDQIKKGDILYKHKDTLVQKYLDEITKIRNMAYRLAEKAKKAS